MNRIRSLQTFSIFFLFLRPNFTTQKVGWSQSNAIFKEYYSRRLSINSKEVVNMLHLLVKMPFKEADHRWSSMLYQVESSLSTLSSYQRVYLLKALSPFNSSLKICDIMIKSFLNQISGLNFQEAVVLLWCFSNRKGSTSPQNIAKIYQRLLALIQKQKQSSSGQYRILVNSKKNQGNQISIRPSTVSMLLSSMSTLKMVDFTLFKIVVKNIVKPNLQVFSVNALCIILASYIKLGLNNKRDTFFVYNRIRSLHKQLESVSQQTLMNLAVSVTALTQRAYSEEEKKRMQKYEDQVQKQENIRKDMAKFILWIAETILIRNQSINLANAANILHNMGKAEAFDIQIWMKMLRIIKKQVEECKVIDLVMAVRAICTLPQQMRKKVKQEENKICQRLWQLHFSLKGHSLQIIGWLYQQHKIMPPPRIIKLIVTDFEARQNKKRAQEMQAESK